VTSDFHDTVAAARGGDRAAYDALFTRNLPALAAYLRARVGGDLGHRESVSDLAQSVCREVLEDLDQLEFVSEEAFRAFLFLQASRKMVDRYRYHTMHKRDPSREQPLPTTSDGTEGLQVLAQSLTPSRAAGAREDLERVELALRELPDNQREAVVLSRIGGISYGTIARQMGLSEAAVRGLVARGLARLAGIMGKT
jgi:RNA polymerase sigma factor (sigma-70 family)